jgi:aspartyl-tRNA(Asn)/glutamyl-tRNA(Gln) amidotransferase subunit A
MKLNELTAHEIRNLLRNGKTSSEEVTRAVFDKIDEEDEQIGAYVTLCKEWAFNRARTVDRKRKDGQTLPPLAGIPIAIKDNICTRDIRTTCSSKILENFFPPYHATVVEKVLASDMVPIGKTNMDEFAMGSSTETSFFGVTRNPWNSEMIPGGSSGGSAASVASDETIISLGSDTGGSIRQPAAMCGVVGLKPTYGRVSRFGLIAFASSLDQIGPLTGDVEDSALLLDAICGHDPRDSTSVDVPANHAKALSGGISKSIIGIPDEYFVSGLEAEIETAVRGAIKVLEGLGAKLQRVSLPHTDYAIATYYIIATAEASSNLARYDGVKYGYRHKAEKGLSLSEMYGRTRSEGFGAEVKRRIELGTYTLSAGYYDAYYLKAQRVRTLIKNDFDKAFKKCDCIIAPTSPTAAFRIGEKIDNPLQMYLSDIFTIPANLSGIPAISIPCGLTEKGLPIGLQIMGKAFDETTILQTAYAYEQTADWRSTTPR